MKNKGISLITLIITIIVIIILAAIVIFTGLNTPDRAQLAKFAQEFSGFQEAVTNAFLNEKMKLSTSGQYRTDEQIYYKIATGTDTTGTPTASGKVSTLGFTTSPEPIQGDNFYKITRTEVEGLKPQEMFSSAGGDLYVTDKGEVFVSPGYLVQENGTNRWYVNASKYHDGEEVAVGSGETSTVNEEDLAKLEAYFYNGKSMTAEYPNEVPILDASTSITRVGLGDVYDYIRYHGEYYKVGTNGCWTNYTGEVSILDSGLSIDCFEGYVDLIRANEVCIPILPEYHPTMEIEGVEGTIILESYITEPYIDTGMHTELAANIDITSIVDEYTGYTATITLTVGGEDYTWTGGLYRSLGGV